MKFSIFLFTLILLSCGTERTISEDQTINVEVDEKDEDIIEFYYSPNFDSIANGLMILVDSTDKMGYKNLRGKWVIPPEYDYSANWSEGTLVVKKEGKYGVINIENEVVIPFDERWKEINSCKSGVFLVHTKDDHFVYFSKNGDQLTSIQKKQEYPRYSPPKEFENGICVVGWERLNWRKQSNWSGNNLSYSIVNNQFDTLYSFKDVWFSIKLGRKSNGFTPIYLYPDTKYGGQGVDHGYYGYLNENGEIAIDIQFSSEYFWGKQRGMSVLHMNNAFHSNGIAAHRSGDSIIYIDTLGNILEQSLSYNQHGIGVKHSRDSIWILHKNGDTLLAGGKNISLGGFGHSLVGGWGTDRISNDIIYLKDSKNRIQYYYSPDFKQLAKFDYSSRDSIFHQMTFTPSEQVLFGVNSVPRGSTHETSTYTQIFGWDGERLSTKIPRGIKVFPKVGCYIDYRPDSLGNRRCRLMNFENEVVFEDTLLQVVGMSKFSHDYGLFAIQRRYVTEYGNYTRFEDVGIINYLGEKIMSGSKRPNFVVNIEQQRQMYRQSETVQLNVSALYFFEKYKELKLDEHQRR